MSIEVTVKREAVSTVSFSNRSHLDAVREHLRKLRATGKLTVNMLQGGVCTITFEARNQLNGHDHIELIFDPATSPR